MKNEAELEILSFWVWYEDFRDEEFSDLGNLTWQYFDNSAFISMPNVLNGTVSTS